MKKLVFLFLLLITCSSVWGQTEYNQIKEQANKWYSSVTSIELLSATSKDSNADPLYNRAQSSTTVPKGTKFKTVDYPKEFYCIAGYFSKGILADGQNVEIYNTESNPLIILSGKVSYFANRLLVTGVKYDYTEDGICYTYGSFYVSNSPDNSMVYKPKKAQALNITDSDIEYYLGYYFKCPTAIRTKGAPRIAVDGKSGGRGFDEYAAPLKEPDIRSIGYNKIVELLLSTNKDAIMRWTDQSAIVFKGAVDPQYKDDGSVYFRFLTGEKTGFKQGHKTVKVYEEREHLCMDLIGDPSSNLSKETLVVLDKSAINKDSYWDLSTFYHNLGEVRWYFKNGDTFIGNATYTEITADDGSIVSYSEKITTGKLKYSNGDYFDGDMSKDFCCNFPTSGTTYFKDGTVGKGNWLNDYKLTDAQWAKISNIRFPTVARDSAKAFQNNNLYEKYLAAATKAERGKHYDEAKSYYQAAKKIKPDAKKWDEIIKGIDKQIFIEGRRKQMTAIYGSSYGPKIAEGIVELGMTRDMVIDAFKIDEVLLHSYHTSTYTDWSDNRVETWEYDYDLAKGYMNKDYGAVETIFDNMISELGTALGYSSRKEFNKRVKYKYLKFKNDKLIELKDKSMYDDFDNATDELSNALLWID